MKKIIILVLSFSVLAGCSYNFKQDGVYAVIKTNMGEMIFDLYYEKTPITAGNFVGLVEGTREFTDVKTGQKVKRNFYNGLTFHRVIKDFVIQGGCPVGNGTGGPGYTFVDEINPDLKHDAVGVLSMANSGPDTNGSQFFITLAPSPHLDGKYTVWGKLVNGINVLKKIGSVETDGNDKPVKDVRIDSIEIKRIGQAAKAFDAEKAFAKNDEIIKAMEQKNETKLSELLKKLNVNQARIKTTDTGLRYFIRRNGKGNPPKQGDIIKAHYTGYLIDGTKFDSSYDRGQPFETQIGVGRVIQGWDIAFLNMKIGEKQVLIIPYMLAYGPQGRPPVIPPMSTLVFEVELLDIQAQTK